MSKYIITDIDKFDRYNSIINSDKYWNPEVYNQKLNEGLLGNVIGKPIGKLLPMFFSEEIKKGEEVANKIKEGLDQIKEKCNSIKDSESKTDNKNQAGKPISQFSKEIIGLINDCQKISFDTMSLLTDTGIGFSNYSGKVLYSEISNLGVLFYPLTNIEIIMTGFNLYMAIIKGTIWSRLLMLETAFVDFELQIQLGIEEGSSEINRLIKDARERLFGEISALAQNQFEGNDKRARNFTKALEEIRKTKEQQDRESGDEYSRYMENIYKTLNDDISSNFKQKNDEEISEYKNLIQNLTNVDDKDVSRFGAIVQNTAVIQANRVCEKIDTNFIKMIDVFKLTNVKEIINKIKENEANNIEEIDDDEITKAVEKAKEDEENELNECEKTYNKYKASLKNINSYLTLDKDVKEQINTYYNSNKFPESERKTKDFLKYVAPIDKEGHLFDFLKKCIKGKEKIFISKKSENVKYVENIKDNPLFKELKNTVIYALHEYDNSVNTNIDFDNCDKVYTELNDMYKKLENVIKDKESEVNKKINNVDN